MSGKSVYIVLLVINFKIAYNGKNGRKAKLLKENEKILIKRKWLILDTFGEILSVATYTSQKILGRLD